MAIANRWGGGASPGWLQTIQRVERLQRNEQPPLETGEGGGTGLHAGEDWIGADVLDMSTFTV